MTPDERAEFLEAFPNGARVLCVDDESAIGEVITKILRTQLRCRVETASSGEEALRRIARRAYDVVVVDYVMPNMDGGELYRRLERDRPEVIPRLMFITGDTLTPSTVEFIQASGRPLLEKPFGLTDLTDAIHRMLVGTTP